MVILDVVHEFAILQVLLLPDGEHVLRYGSALVKVIVEDANITVVICESTDPKYEATLPSRIFGDDSSIGHLKSLPDVSLESFTIGANQESEFPPTALHFLLQGGRPSALVEWHKEAPRAVSLDDLLA